MRNIDQSAIQAKRVIIGILSALYVFVPQGVSAGLVKPEMKGAITQRVIDLASKIGLATSDMSPGVVIGELIKAFLGLLGIIFVALIIYAGYCWMTSSGNEGKAIKAKNTTHRAIVGLIIITGAYSITYFVFRNL